MKAIAACFLFAICLVAMVAVLPSSRWILLNQIDLVKDPPMVATDSDDDSVQSEGSVDAYTPKWVEDPKTYTGSDPAEQIAHAEALHDQARLLALTNYTATHPQDPLGFALVVRSVCTEGAHTPDIPKPKGYHMSAEKKNILETGIEAASKGEKLEPNNAYFPLYQAVLELELNDVSGMQEALADAASKTGYDDHIGDQALAAERAVQLAKGYRGELVRLKSAWSLTLPDFTHLTSLAKYLNRVGRIEDKRNLVQVAYRIEQNEETAIGFLVAMKALKLQVRSPASYSSDRTTKYTEDEYLALSADFDRKIVAAGLRPPSPSTAEIYRGLSSLVAATGKYMDSLSPWYQSFSGNPMILGVEAKTVAPYAALDALVFVVLLSGLIWSCSMIRSDLARTLTPHLTVLPMGLLGILAFRCCEEPSMAGFALGIGQLFLALNRLPKQFAVGSTLFLGSIVLPVALNVSLVMNSPWCGTLLLYIVLAVLPWIVGEERRTLVAQYGGALLAIVAGLAMDPSAALGGISYFVVLGMQKRNQLGVAPKALEYLTIGASIIVSGVVGIAFAFGGTFHPGQSLAAIFIVAVVCAALYVGKSERLARNTICASFGLFGSCYLLTVGVDLRMNQAERGEMMGAKYEGQKIREISKLDPLALTKGGLLLRDSNR